MRFHQAVKRYLKWAMKPAVTAARPAIEQAAYIDARLSRFKSGLKVVTESTWNATFDEALDHLPAPAGVTRDQYRELLQPTQHIKRHALVLENDTPLAIISVRRRNHTWEPVAYQSLPGFIAPARDLASIGRAINASGMDVTVEAGLGPEAHSMGARYHWSYDAVQVALRADYESYWNLDDGKQALFVSSARKKCKRMHLVIDGPGDLEWTIDRWKEQWAKSPDNQIAAAPDRIRFWKSLGTCSDESSGLKTRTFALYDGNIRVAGLIATVSDKTLLDQCVGHLPKYRNRGVGTRTFDAALAQCVVDGFEYFDLGGGHGYKSLWGPVATKRYAALFRPRLINFSQSWVG
tara:strand:+ start:3581 stop:4627 length:1047 start_codon:yes stop_codon:yes gene_type:complete